MGMSNLLVAAALVGSQAASVAAPKALLQWAADDPLTFAQVLAHAGLAAGVELTVADHQRFSTQRRRWNPEQWTAESIGLGETASVDVLVAAFNESHVDHQASADRGVVLIRPVRRRAAYLDSRPLSGRLTAIGLMRMGEKIFHPLDPRLDAPGGRLGSTLSPVGVEIDWGEGREFNVRADGLTVAEVLNDVVRQAPGHAWVVLVSAGSAPHVLRFGFIHNYGVMSYLPVGEVK